MVGDGSPKTTVLGKMFATLDQFHYSLMDGVIEVDFKEDQRAWRAHSLPGHQGGTYASQEPRYQLLDSPEWSKQLESVSISTNEYADLGDDISLPQRPIHKRQYGLWSHDSHSNNE